MASGITHKPNLAAARSSQAGEAGGHDIMAGIFPDLDEARLPAVAAMHERGPKCFDFGLLPQPQSRTWHQAATATDEQLWGALPALWPVRAAPLPVRATLSGKVLPTQFEHFRRSCSVTPSNHCARYEENASLHVAWALQCCPKVCCLTWCLVLASAATLSFCRYVA